MAKVFKFPQIIHEHIFIYKNRFEYQFVPFFFMKSLKVSHIKKWKCKKQMTEFNHIWIETLDFLIFWNDKI